MSSIFQVGVRLSFSDGNAHTEALKQFSEKTAAEEEGRLLVGALTLMMGCTIDAGEGGKIGVRDMLALIGVSDVAVGIRELAIDDALIAKPSKPNLVLLK